MEKNKVIGLGNIPMSAFDRSDESSNTIEHFECFGDVPIDILMHHGIKGMKWGIRRYQNKDGSLTKAGRKRYAKLEAELEQLKGAKNTTSSGRDKRPKDMTDDELRDSITRMRLEDEYNTYYNKLNPKKQKNGQKYLETFMSKAVLGISEGTQGVLRDVLVEKAKEALGLKKDNEKKPKTEYEQRKEEYDLKKLDYDMAKLKKDRANLNKDDDDDPEYRALKREYDRRKLRKDMDALDKNEVDSDAELAKEATRLTNKMKVRKAKEWFNDPEHQGDIDEALKDILDD